MGTRNEGRSSPFGGQRLIPVMNGSESAIPAGGIVWLDGATTIGGQGVMSAKQANGASHPYFVALTAIGVGGRGVVSRDWPAWAAYDTAAATPAVGDSIGPVSGNWRLRPTGSGFTAITAGENGWVMVIGTEAVTAQSTLFVKFTLGAALSGGSATATVNRYWGGDDPGASVTVLDLLGKFKGGLTGSQGIATLDEDEDDWVVLECTTKATRIRFELTGTLSGTGTATIVDFWDGDDPGSSTTVVNVEDEDGGYLFEGESGMTGTAHYDPNTDTYVIESLKCPPE